MRPRSDNDDNNLGYICEISPDKFNWFDEDGQPFDLFVFKNIHDPADLERDDGRAHEQSGTSSIFSYLVTSRSYKFCFM